MNQAFDGAKFSHEIDRYLNKALEYKNFEPEMYRSYIIELLEEASLNKHLESVASAIFSYSSKQKFIPYKLFKSSANEIENEIDDLWLEEEYEDLTYSELIETWLKKQ